VIEEYKMLREEIAQDRRIIFQLFTFSITTSTLLIGYGTAQIEVLPAWFYLSPLCIIIPCSLVMITFYVATLQKASYIRFKLEGGDLAWETSIRKLGRGLWTYQVFFTHFPQATIAVFSLLIFAYKNGGYASSLLGIFLLSIIAIIFCCIILPVWLIPYYDRKFEVRWREILKSKGAS
jgi:hypothetical protein